MSTRFCVLRRVPGRRYEAAALIFLGVILCIVQTKPTVAGPFPQDREVAESPTWTCKDATSDHVLWHVKSGSDHGPLLVHQGKVLLGTNNGYPDDSAFEGRFAGDWAFLLCLSADDGSVLWRSPHERLRHRAHDIPFQAIHSRPFVDDDRVYYVSNRGELMCVDLQGFRDGENNGPFRAEAAVGPDDVDVRWRLDMPAELGVFKRDAWDISNPTSSPLVLDDLVFCVTGNGSTFGYDRRFGADWVPKPDAPSFIAVEKTTGKVKWSSNAPGKNILYGQWSSPVHVKVEGADQVIFPGGDGWLYAFEPTTGKLIWKLDANQPGSKSWQHRLPFDNPRQFTVGAPSVLEGKIYASLSLDWEFNRHRGLLFAVDPRFLDDKAILWRFADDKFRCTVAPVAVADGILYTVSINGVVFAIDAHTGEKLWDASLGGAPQEYNYPYVHDGKVYVAALEHVFVFSAGREKECLGKYDLFNEFVCYAPASDGQRLYVGTRGHVWALRLPRE